MADSDAPETREAQARRLGYYPLTLSDKQRRYLESKGVQLIQPRPDGEKPIPTDMKGIEGIPFDVMFALEALRQLAEHGNSFARFMYEQERQALGIDTPKRG